MKQLFLTFATCVCMLTGCSKNEVIDRIDHHDGKLTFNTAIGKQTRAAELTNGGLIGLANAEDNGVALFAYQQTAIPGTYKTWFVDSLWYEARNWKINSTRFRNTAATKYVTYFPKAHVIRIPGFETATFATEDYCPAFTYTVQDPASQEDLVAGITDVAENKTDVVIAMRHILAQINFGVKSYQGAQIEIKDIVIHNVFNRATYTYGISNGYTLGQWSNWGTDGADGEASATYAYTKKGGAVPVALADVEDVETDDIYIFGDGGNFGPGKTGTWYPDENGNNWVTGNGVTDTEKMDNSFMLMPQNFTTETDPDKKAYVSFKYTIKDISGAFVADTTGRFLLDFTSSNELDYASRWQQNLRYVYIIDFKEFLTDNKLTFNVDLKTYPWENYNQTSGAGDGIVGVPIIGQATENTINSLFNGDALYAATRSNTSPTRDVQVITDETWHWDVYPFNGLVNNADSISIYFTHVLFNNKKININVDGTKFGISLKNQQEAASVTVNAATDTVVIKKKN